MDRISLVCEYMLPRVVLAATSGCILAQARIPDPPESSKRPSSRTRLEFNSEKERHHQAKKEALLAARARLRAARAAAVPKYYLASLPNLKTWRDKIQEADIREQCARKLQRSYRGFESRSLWNRLSHRLKTKRIQAGGCVV